MRFMVIVKGPQDPEGTPPDPQLMADMNKFNDELLKAGVLLGYDGLHPSSKGARVHFSGKNRPTVIDGPFVESKPRLHCPNWCDLYPISLRCWLGPD